MLNQFRVKVDPKHEYCDYIPQCCEDFTVRIQATVSEFMDKNVLRLIKVNFR